MLVVEPQPRCEPAAARSFVWDPASGSWPPGALERRHCPDLAALACLLASTSTQWVVIVPPAPLAGEFSCLAAALEVMAMDLTDYATLVPAALPVRHVVSSGRNLWGATDQLAGQVLAARVAVLREDLGELNRRSPVESWPWLDGVVPPVPAGRKPRRVLCHLGTVAYAAPARHPRTPLTGPSAPTRMLVVQPVSAGVERALDRCGGERLSCTIDSVSRYAPWASVLVVSHRDKDAVDLRLRDAPQPTEVWVDLDQADWSHSMRWIPGRDRIAPGSPTSESWRI